MLSLTKSGKYVVNPSTICTFEGKLNWSLVISLWSLVAIC